MAELVKNKNYSMNFFGSMNGNFSVSPQDYHNKWRKQVGARKSFLGPWNYAGSHRPVIKSKFHGPQETVGTGTYKEPRGFLSPGNTIQRGSYKTAKGFVSPVAGYEGTTRRTSFKYGDNRTQALSEE